MATLDLPDLTLWYERFGTPDPARRLLVFNGSGATIEASRPLIDKLAEHFDLAVHDQRCLGRTGLPPTQPTMGAPDTIQLHAEAHNAKTNLPVSHRMLSSVNVHHSNRTS